jgi:hypothetical protein
MMARVDAVAAREVPTWRLYLLRAMYLLVVVGLGMLVWPQFFHRTHPWAYADGIIACMLVAFSLLSLLGLRYPLQMLPILLWELVWKAVWLGVIALPLWRSGQVDEATAANTFACSLVILVVIAIPWRFVFDHYVRKQGDRWSVAQ